MKLGYQDFAATLKNALPRLRLVLLFGPDHGLIKEFGRAAVMQLLGQEDDPFRLARLTGAALKDDPRRLFDEAAAISFGGGSRVVWVSALEGEAAAQSIVAWLSEGGDPGAAILIVEAAELNPRSALRKLAETRDDALAVGCYPDNPRAISDLIRSTFAASGVRLSADAFDYLASRLGADRQATRSELEKLILALHGSDANDINRETIASIIGDNALLSLDDAIEAALTGNIAALTRALDHAYFDGETSVGIVRVALRHLQRLYYVRARIDENIRINEAIAELMPPVFKNQVERFAGQVRRWSKPAIETAMAHLSSCEIAAKSTGFPDEAITRQAMLSIATLLPAHITRGVA